MKQFLIVTATLTLATAGTAQTGHLYSPKFLAAKEGQYSTSIFGAYADMRYQTIDGENRGKVAVLKEVALRLDHRNHASYTAMGRTWTGVNIDVADGDAATFSSDFSTNRTSTPTRVFSGSVTWPSATGLPATRPTPWGGTNGEYRFPFSKSWLYLGQSDIVTDWQFSGGTLANSSVWSSTRSASYYMDSFGSGTSSTSATGENVPTTRLNNNSAGVTGRCNDSAWGTTTTGAYLYGYAYSYGSYYSNIDWRDKLVVRSYSYYTAPNAPVMHAWGFQTNKAGLDIGTGCNRLHISGPMLVHTHMVPPKSVNRSGYSGYKYFVTPWSANMANFKLTMQAAWVDSKSGMMNLSQARELTLPAAAPQSAVAARSAIYQRSGSATVSGPYGTYSYNPALRYAY